MRLTLKGNPLKTSKAFRLALACWAIISITSCTHKGRDAEVQLADGTSVKAAYNETLRVNLSSEPPTLDWTKSSDTVSAQVEANMMDGLIQYDFKGKEVNLVPGLAARWESSNQSRTWKFTLRNDVKWTDGKEFTAQQVVDGWKRLLDAKTASQYAYGLFGIKGAEEFNQGKIKDFSQVGVKINSPTEITVELKTPMSYFPYLLTHQSTYPVRMDLIEKYGDKWTDPKNLVTLGALKMGAWEHDKQIVLQRNDSYYGDKPFLKFIVMYMIQEQATALNLFDSGKLDAVMNLPSIELAKLKKRPEYQELGLLQIYYYGLNTKTPPMNNVKVRQAIGHAIDRARITQMLAGGQIPLSGWIPPGMFGYEPDKGLNFDPAKAKQLLKEAGYADPSKFPKLVIAFNTSEDHQRIAESVQAQLKENLGIDVELKNQEWKVYLKSLQVGDYPMFRFGWLADFPDPHNFFSLMMSNSDNNQTFWKNAQFDKLVEQGASEPDKNKRREIYLQAQKILVEDEAPVIPILASVQHALVAQRVENFPINPIAQLVYKGVRLK